MKLHKSLTCELSCYRADAPVESGVYAPQEWFAIATTHVYDPRPPTNTRVPMTPAAVVLSGAAMRILEGRGSGTTELAAMSAALEVLALQLESFRNQMTSADGPAV